MVVKGQGWWSILFVHSIFVLLYGVFYFRLEFLQFMMAPVFAIGLPIQSYLLGRYLKRFKQDIPAEAVIVLGQSDWFKLEAWMKHNFLIREIKLLVAYLEKKGQDFSFYSKASLKDVEDIMSNKNIKEVYFFGHGSSHNFQLNTDELIYYCDFADQDKYGKELVHQVHCGTTHGKSLVDYVVPKENQNKCFLFRKPINSKDISKELKRRINDI